LFKRKPKKLTLRQVHELYLLLKHALPKQDKELLIDQVQYILQRAYPGTLDAAFKIMYGKPLKVNPIQAAAFFIRGLNETKFFAYVDFLRNLNGRRDSNSKA
jgi:hypothetical protein